MIEHLIGISRYFSARLDDDVADRMNYLYTPNILLAFSVLISFKQFGGRPLECLMPAKLPGSWEQVRTRKYLLNFLLTSKLGIQRSESTYRTH